MATSFLLDVTAAVKEQFTKFIKFTIAAYNRWRAISSEHAVTRTFSLRIIARSVDANLTGADAVLPQPLTFDE
jgi:hypothetical protein